MAPVLMFGLRIDRQSRGGPAVVHRLLIVVADIDVDLTAALGFRGQIRGDRRLPRYGDAGRALDIGIGIGQGRAVGAKVDGIGVHRKAIGNRDLSAMGIGHEIGDGTDIAAGAGAGIEQGVHADMAKGEVRAAGAELAQSEREGIMRIGRRDLGIDRDVAGIEVVAGRGVEVGASYG